jgi:hypothetical protein
VLFAIHFFPKYAALFNLPRTQHSVISRAYSPNGGVAIGFDFELVGKGFLCDITRRLNGHKVETPIRADPENRLMRCEYTDGLGRLDLGATVERRFFGENQYAALFHRPEPLARYFFGPLLSAAVYQTICSIKHGAYMSEEEWRCVNYMPDPTDYPVRLSETNRFYVEMSFDRRAFIKEVWISPHGDINGCENAVAHFKQTGGLQFQILSSRIPFREWPREKKNGINPIIGDRRDRGPATASGTDKLVGGL